MKPYGRQTKKKVFHILSNEPRSQALEMLEQIPDEQLVGHLFSHFYHTDELIKFRSVTAMGHLVLRLSGKKMEKARVVLRRIMWNLNDESGGIGWGSPEAMGEILKQSPELALEFKSILFSYLDHRGNHIEHEMLQRGVLWGIGTYLEAAPGDLTEITKNQISSHLHSKDPVKRGFAIRALINADSFDCRLIPEHIIHDQETINIYTGWNLVKTRISDMSHACSRKPVSA
jgi:DNA-binding transcriptional ArsR family regulator